MSQQVDLEELTRLYDYYCTNEFKDEDTKRRYFLQFASDLAKSFPALRDELLQYRSGAVKQIVSEINKQVDDSVALRKENAEMRDELVRLRERDKNAEAKQRRAMLKNINIRRQLDDANAELVRLRGEREQWRMSSVCREYKRQLDEAKGLLERAASSCISVDDPLWDQKTIREIRAFLASLAGSNPKQYAFTNCEGKTIHLPGDMTMEDMVRAGITPSLVDQGTVSSDPKDFIHRDKQQAQPTQGDGFTEEEVREWMKLNHWEKSYNSAARALDDAETIILRRKPTTPPEVEGGEG